MTEPPPYPSDDDHDDRLLDRLRAALDQADPVPTATSGTARSLLRWRSDDADLALLGLADLTPVRSGSTLQLHRFTIEGIEIELTVDGQAVTGLIDPWPLDGPADGSATVTVELAAVATGRTDRAHDGTDDQTDDGRATGGRATDEATGTAVTVEVDEDGEFELAPTGRGPLRLVLTAGHRRIRTEWILPG